MQITHMLHGIIKITMIQLIVRKSSENHGNTGWNDKIVALKKTTLQLYFIEKNQFR